MTNLGRKEEKRMEKGYKDYKTGYSTSIKISTMENIKESAVKLGISQADVGRRIFEYFYEHNDIEDLLN